MADTIFSTRSGSTGRLRKEICTERTNLSRSNGTRRPLRLITVSSRSCTRSKVVKRKLQATQTRRRRIAEESSVGRESFTWVSRLVQLGQRIVRSSSVNRKTCQQALDLVAHRRLDQTVRRGALLRQHIKYFGNQRPNLAEFGGAEPAGGAGRRSKPDAGCHRGFFRIERNAVLVAGHVRTPQRCL